MSINTAATRDKKSGNRQYSEGKFGLQMFKGTNHITPGIAQADAQSEASERMALSKQNRFMTFAELKIGERFEFKNKSTVACGKYNGEFTKVTDGSFRGQCFTGYPDPSVEVVACPQGAN